MSRCKAVLSIVSFIACGATVSAQVAVSSEFIYELEGRQTPQCHASTIVETPKGIVAAWFGGTHEKNPDVGIWVSRRIEGEWSKPIEVVDGSEGEDQEYACWNPVLFQPEDGPLLLFYKVGLDPRNWWGAIITSDDAGESWSKPRRLGTSSALPEANQNLLGPVKNKPVMLADGTLLCGTSTENEGWKIHFEVTRDLGKTWDVIGPIHDASKFNAIQPSVLSYSDGRMQILCRSREKRIVQSWSEDGGKTWGPVTATDLPNPNSGTDAVTLSDGRQLLIYNPLERGRHVLKIAVSSDGAEWKDVITLEDEERGEYSYPAIIQASDGRIHVTYTWQRKTVRYATFDPAEIH